MFENGLLRRIFGPKREEIIGELRKLHKKELNDLHSTQSTFRLFKPRRMRWARHPVRRGEERCIQGFGGET